MDYEKAYKEALERAKKLHKDAITLQLEQDIKDYEFIFPELQENEDERIRKALIQGFFEYDNSFATFGGIKVGDIIAWLEKQGEQKPADKVEPKFKQGDWVTNSIETVQITGYDIDYGYQVDYKGNLQHRDTDIIEKEYHLWAIQDAKDGDVLVSLYNKPFIYNGNRDSFNIGSYCGISVEDRFNISTEKCRWTVIRKIYPATKEQRDLLFQKMREAGYEWNAEKKELKRLAWSEEDEVKVNRIVSYLENFNVADNDILLKDVDWLKSLKQRML